MSESREEQFIARMRFLGVAEEDFEEHFVRSSGPGGQNVNKVATCVILKHIPTGFQVKVQQFRNQNQNRILARNLLLDLIEKEKKIKELKKKHAVEKIRRQNRKRSISSKERTLKNKKKHGEIKKLRASINPGRLED